MYLQEYQFSSRITSMSQVTPQEAIVLDHLKTNIIKQTIVSLRDELASKDIGLEKFIQQNLAGLNAENSLKESISNLALNNLRVQWVSNEEEKQSILRSSQSEILNLKNLIKVLRVELQTSEERRLDKSFKRYLLLLQAR